MKCRWFSSGQMQKTKWTPNLTLTKNTHWFGETAIFMSHDLESFNWNDHYNSWIFIGWHGRHPAPVDRQFIPLFTRLLLWKQVKIPQVQSSMSHIWDLSLDGLQPESRCEADKNSTTASRFSKREELRVQMGNDSLARHFFFPKKGFLILGHQPKQWKITGEISENHVAVFDLRRKGNWMTLGWVTWAKAVTRVLESWVCEFLIINMAMENLMSNREYIFRRSIFYCHVSLPKGREKPICISSHPFWTLKSFIRRRQASNLRLFSSWIWVSSCAFNCFPPYSWSKKMAIPSSSPKRLNILK